MKTTAALLLLPLVMLSAGRTTVAPTAHRRVPAAHDVCRVRSVKLTDFRDVLDGQWQGVIKASDGNAYFGSSTHSAHHGASFFKYDPRTDKVTMLVEDMTRICGENPDKTPQNKLHSPIAEHNGWLYTATHYSCDKKGSEEAYTGSHVLGYELATGRWRDFGIVLSNATCYSGITVDPKADLIYVFVTPITKEGAERDGGSRMFRIDIPTGRKQDLGVIQPGDWDASYWLFVDSAGNLWFTSRKSGGTLFRVKAGAGAIERFQGAVARATVAAAADERTRARQAAGAWWRWGGAVGDDQWVFTTYGSDRLWLFDARKDPTSPEAFREIAEIGGTDLGVALGGGRVYYVQRADRVARAKGNNHHLMSLSLAPDVLPRIIDHGRIFDQDNRKPWRIPSLAADARGNVCMVGDWFLNEGEKGTNRYFYRDGKEGYRQLWRGQFFATVDLHEQLP